MVGSLLALLSLWRLAFAQRFVGRGFPFIHAVGDARGCLNQKDMQMTSTQFWRKADEVAHGYPTAQQRYVRWLALKLSGSLAESFTQRISDKEYAERYCGNSYHQSVLDEALTLVGLARLQNVAQLVLDVAAKAVPGDFVEAGVWRGGTCIFAKALFDLLGESQRAVHVFDAFAEVKQYKMGLREVLNVRQDTVEQSFEIFQAHDRMVKFHKGFFKDTMQKFWKDYWGTDLKIAILRIDANFYDGHQDSLYWLYNFVPVGGYVIFDDLFTEPGAAQAWREFRHDHNITEQMIRIDLHGGYFQKTREVVVDPFAERRS